MMRGAAMGMKLRGSVESSKSIIDPGQITNFNLSSGMDLPLRKVVVRETKSKRRWEKVL